MNLFTQPVTQTYDLNDATWEILLMLLVSFILGWFFQYFWGRTNRTEVTLAQDSVPHKYAGIIESDLKIVEGIGPKIEELLKKNDIRNWKDLATTDAMQLRTILMQGGDRFQMHDPSSWSDQAALAVEKKWTELEEYQELLIGGRTN
jgi:hypothetical protein